MIEYVPYLHKSIHSVFIIPFNSSFTSYAPMIHELYVRLEASSVENVWYYVVWHG